MSRIMILNSHNKSIGSILDRISVYQEYYILYLSLLIANFFWSTKLIPPKSHVIHCIFTITRIILAFLTRLLSNISDMPISLSLHHIFMLISQFWICDVRCMMCDCMNYKAWHDYPPILDIKFLQFCDRSISLHIFSSHIFSSHVLILQICHCNKYIASSKLKWNLILRFSNVTNSNTCLYAINI